jgi:hypothetical protein
VTPRPDARPFAEFLIDSEERIGRPGRSSSGCCGRPIGGSFPRSRVVFANSSPCDGLARRPIVAIVAGNRAHRPISGVDRSSPAERGSKSHPGRTGSVSGPVRRSRPVGPDPRTRVPRYSTASPVVPPRGPSFPGCRDVEQQDTRRRGPEIAGTGFGPAIGGTPGDPMVWESA